MKIFGFQKLRKPRFENKRNFWINCDCIKAFVSWYSHKKTFASLHTHERASTSLHIQRDICTTTYPLKGICTTRHLHLHLYKKTFASRLNMCVSTIMDKFCICTPAWDIYIMKIASLKGDMCIIWTFCICILVKSIWIENENLDLHNILFALIEYWHLGQ